MMLPLKHKLNRNVLETIYNAYVRPILEYADVVFDNSTENLKNTLDNIQIRAAHIVTGAKRHTSHALCTVRRGGNPFVSDDKYTSLFCSNKLLTTLLQDTWHSYYHYLALYAPLDNVTNNWLANFNVGLTISKESFFPSTIDIWNKALTDKDR